MEEQVKSKKRISDHGEVFTAQREVNAMLDLFKIFDERYTALFKDKCKEDYRRSVRFLLNRNILWGDVLDFTNPVTKEPIVFSEGIKDMLKVIPLISKSRKS
jgi:hypothetical protein